MFGIVGHASINEQKIERATVETIVQGCDLIQSDDVEGLDFDPTAGFRGEIMQAGPSAAAHGADDAPSAFPIFFDQGKTEPTRCADDECR
jgi:hypothetical protein